jgi:flagellar biosynthesis/type III secretory pathway protein FliH
MLNLQTHRPGPAAFAYTFLEVPKFTTPLHECHTDIEKWMYFLKYHKDINASDIDLLTKDKPILKEAYMQIARYAWDTPQLHAYEAYQDAVKVYNEGLDDRLQEGMERGIEKGIEKGIEQGIEKGMEKGMEKGRQEGIEQGIEKGIEEGIAKGELMTKVTIAKALLAQGMSLPQIAALVQIPEPDLQHLLNE